MRLITPAGRLASGGVLLLPFASKHPVHLSLSERFSGGPIGSGLETAMRRLFSNFGFTISVFLAVAITAVFAFIFEVSLQIIVSMLVIGLFTAIVEYVMRSRQQPHKANP
jgi:hypothetical protein